MDDTWLVEPFLGPSLNLSCSPESLSGQAWNAATNWFSHSCHVGKSLTPPCDGVKPLYLCFPCSHDPRTASAANLFSSNTCPENTNFSVRHMSRKVCREKILFMCVFPQRNLVNNFSFCHVLTFMHESLYKLQINTLASSIISTKKQNNVHVSCHVIQDLPKKHQSIKNLLCS